MGGLLKKIIARTTLLVFATSFLFLIITPVALAENTFTCKYQTGGTEQGCSASENTCKEDYAPSCQGSNEADCLASAGECISTKPEIPIAEQVAGFYNWAIGISALVALGILVYAGLAYTVAGGNASRQQDAKQWIWNALIGLALLFGSFLILNTINPDLTKLQNLDLSQVQVEKIAEAPQAAKSLDLPQLIGNFYNWALGIGGLIALGIIIFGGILYTISPGNSSRQNEAKIWIGSAIAGLVLLFGSYAILNTVNPDLTKLVSLEESLKKTEFKAAPEATETVKEVDLSELIANFYQWALGIGGLIALAVLIFGGILYTTSAGNASRQDDAKQWIMGALLGLVLLFGSYAILYTINPDLTKLTNLKEMLGKNKGAEPDSQVQSQELKGKRLDEIITEKLGRKSLHSTGVYQDINSCGPAPTFGHCSVDAPVCDELQRYGARCGIDIFVPILSFIPAPPAGLLELPLNLGLLKAAGSLSTGFFNVLGFNLTADVAPEGDCETPLNPVLVENAKTLKEKISGDPAINAQYVVIQRSVCVSGTFGSVDAWNELQDKDKTVRGHPFTPHTQLRAVDFKLQSEDYVANAKEKNKEILEFLKETRCANNLIAPTRFGNLCVKNGQKGVECTGIRDARGNEEEIIHYDIKSNCK